MASHLSSTFRASRFLAVILVLLVSACETFEEKEFPSEVSTGQIDTVSLIAQGELVIVGQDIQRYGHVWSLAFDPDLSDSLTNLGQAMAELQFQSQLSIIRLGSRHYYRAYAVDIHGTTYFGKTQSFRPI